MSQSVDSHSDTGPPNTVPDSPREGVWAGLIGVTFVVSMALAYRPTLDSVGGVVDAVLPWLVLAGMVLAWSGRTFPTRLVGLLTAIAAWYWLIISDDRWSMLSFALYALCFIVDSTRMKVGLSLAGLVSAIWTVASLGGPVWTVLIPLFVFVAASTIAYAIHRIGRLTATQAELIRQLESTREDLATSERSRGALQERTRLAGEIHDTLAQGFTSIVPIDGATIGADEIVVVPLDHRGNVKRSHHTMQRYLQSDSALAIIGGLHSPPYLTHREFLNSNAVLTLLPWSAAGPITRAAKGNENWIFRLSVDDHQSGRYLVREAVERGGCERMALVLLDSGWGHANLATLTKELDRHGQQPVIVRFYDNAIGSASSRTLAREIARAKADCGILLSNWNDGALLVNSMAAVAPDFRIFSHWGITGGAFASHVPHATRMAVNLSFLQTCGLRRERDGSPRLRAALAASGRGVRSLAEMPASTGFVHGHDLTRILVAAIRQAARTGAWHSGRIEDRRDAVRNALESLNAPVEGILNFYDPPFRRYSENDPDAHEALGHDDLCTARFRQDGMLEDAS